VPKVVTRWHHNIRLTLTLTLKLTLALTVIVKVTIIYTVKDDTKTKYWLY